MTSGELQHPRYSGRTLGRGGWDAVGRGAASAADIELVQCAIICARIGATRCADERTIRFDVAPGCRHEKLAAAKTQHDVARHPRPHTQKNLKDRLTLRGQ